MQEPHPSHNSTSCMHLPALGPEVLSGAADPDVLGAHFAALVGAGRHVVSGDGLVQQGADLVIGGKHGGGGVGRHGAASGEAGKMGWQVGKWGG